MSYAPGDIRDTEICVHRAAAIGSHHVPTLAIMAHDEWPDSKDVDLQQLAANFDGEAQQIADALIASLPGGTLDRLIGRLLAYKASHFVVNYGTTSIPARTESGAEA